MARQFDGVNDNLQATGLSGLPTDFPVTFVGWMQRDDTHDGVIVDMADNSQSTYFVGIRTSGGKAGVYIRDSGTSATQDEGSTDLSTGTWYRIVGVFRSSTDREIYVNGVSDGSFSSTRGWPSGIDTITVGSLGDTTPNWYLDGRAADVGIYKVALTDDEIAALNHLPCSRVRPSDLVFYSPVYGNTTVEPDLSGNGYNLTNSGSAAADHAPVGRYAPMPDGFINLVSGGGGSQSHALPVMDLGLTMGTIGASKSSQLPTIDLGLTMGSIGSSKEAQLPTIDLGLTMGSIGSSKEAQLPAIDLGLTMGAIGASKEALLPTIDLGLTMSEIGSSSGNQLPVINLGLTMGSIGASKSSQLPVMDLGLTMGSIGSSKEAQLPVIDLGLTMGAIGATKEALLPTMDLGLTMGAIGATKEALLPTMDLGLTLIPPTSGGLDISFISQYWYGKVL